MKITCRAASPAKVKSDVLVAGVFEGAVSDLNRLTGDAISLKKFQGKLGESRLIDVPGVGRPALLLVGLGPVAKFGLATLRKAGCKISDATSEAWSRKVAFDLESFVTADTSLSALAQCLTEIMIMGHYVYDRYKSENKPGGAGELIFICESNAETKSIQKASEVGRVVSEAANFSRDLQNHPGNYLTPRKLGNIARALAKENGLKCRVLNEAEIRSAKMGGLLGVAQGSKEPPRFVILEHRPARAKKKTIVFVGKGMTFDSGGISIKPSARMEEMKFDMSGAAAVLGLMKAVSELKLSVNVVGLIPTAENMPSSSAVKPGDILKTSAGTTVEVINTDAEGRLILADALTYARKFKPSCVIDLATLTGACVVALGYHASGLLGNDQELMQSLTQAGEKTGERLWQLPLWDEYYDDIKGDYADIKNSSGPPAGAITAGAFLGSFTKELCWAHLDIAGTAWITQKRNYLGKGGTGVGVRLLVQFLQSRQG